VHDLKNTRFAGLFFARKMLAPKPQRHKANPYRRLHSAESGRHSQGVVKPSSINSEMF
jgi:hypothetical protein